LTSGHRYPEPTGPRFIPCRIVATPVAIMDMQIRFSVSAGVPPMVSTITTGKIKAMDRIKMCWKPIMINMVQGGVSWTS